MMMESKETPPIVLRLVVSAFALLGVLAFVGLGSAASAFGANTYYVSKSTGSDSHTAAQAQSKSTPWAHLPGMCYATCGPSYNPVAGDQFIMMGCDVWTQNDLPATWKWSGTSGNPIVVGGEDQTWYNSTNCPSGWNRPVFNAQKNVLTSNNYFLDPSSDGSGPVTVETHDVTFDNIEMTQLEITSGSSGGYINWVDDNSFNMTFSNMYLHAWDASADNCILIQGPYLGGTSSNDVYKYNVIDGSDRTGTSGTTGACYVFYTSYSGVKILNNVIRYVVNPFVGYSASGSEIGGNLIEYGLVSVGGSHCNMVETEGGTFWIHDNIFRNFQCAGGETLWVGNAANEVDYVWNNVIYNLNAAQTVNAGEHVTGIQVYYWNNTVVPPSGATCLASDMAAGGSITLYAQNNHCITTASNAIDPSFSNYGTVTNTNNLLQTPAQADADATTHFDQYTPLQTYANSPVVSTNSTVGQGTNLTSLWPNGYPTNDAQYGVAEQTINGVVQAVLGRPTNPRSGTWDIGAYEFGSQGLPPNPPTALQAVVQ
jgi:hypothetical protein